MAWVDMLCTGVELVGTGGEVVGDGCKVSDPMFTLASNQASIVGTFALIQVILVVAVFKKLDAVADDNNVADSREARRVCN